MKLVRYITLLVGLLLISFYMWLVFNQQNKSDFYDFGENIPKEYPVLGIDISHYQGDIDWQKLIDMSIDDDSIEFVFIKATEGISLQDDCKRKNAIGARSVEIDYGFYHFFIPGLSARKQADFFCSAIEGYNFDLRPVMDLELESDFSDKRLLDSVDVFLDRVEERLNVRPIIYTSANYFNLHLEALEEEFWIAQYNRKCDYMDLEKVICWQFSESGTVDGISEPVDLNVAKDDFLRHMRR